MDVRPESSATNASLTRRSLVRTTGKAAWVAPVIVVATAAPATALSGRANVSTIVTPSRTGDQLTVDLQFINRNTQPTGLVSVAVYFEATAPLPRVAAQTPTINPGGTNAAWSYISSGGTAPRAQLQLLPGRTRDPGRARRHQHQRPDHFVVHDYGADPWTGAGGIGGGYSDTERGLVG